MAALPDGRAGYHSWRDPGCRAKLFVDQIRPE
jgi:hypothetical protein